MFQQTSDFRRWAGTNLDATTFATKSPTLTKPVASATAAVINLTNNLPSGAIVPNRLKLLFLLLGADGDVASFRIIGWNKAMDNTNPPLWVPQPILEVSCTASAVVGVAGSPVLSTERFVDTIAPVALMSEDRKIAAGTSLNADVFFYTPANDTIGHVILPNREFELMEFTLDQTTNTPTGNILYAFGRDV
jgi:hypothetical protein